ncbi:hypothetical protein E4T48_01949 [Aureobasidium sp. EXF-10727]|nr:hypothetical protein E4T48_01949 [Aureobasidium sp. EXF-10727]
MPSSEYTSAGGGLKLKGAKNAGIEKKRKKKSSKSSAVAAAATSSKDATPAKDTTEPEDTTDLEQREKNKQETLLPDDGKTEYERRHEETRRKRLEEKLMREGVKTHKERVEELNKYLSTLSEHHDMPRIGPG